MRTHLAGRRAATLGALAAVLILSAAMWADAGDYAAIDRHARAAPPAAERSVSSLGRYLAGCGEGDRERARAVFVWITDSINYDVSCLGIAPDASAVLRDRRAVCAGYAALFKALAEAAGLEARIVYGEARGRGPGPARSSDGLFEHDWNAVKVGGEWMLVDSTWGAGQLDERGRFRARFDDHYLLTPPEQFIYDHLPKEPKWQLLEQPVSRQEFLRQVEVHPGFFRYRLRLISHTAGYIEAGSRISITVGAPPEVTLMASLHQDGAELEEGHTFAQRKAAGWQIQAVFPERGAYLLKVHARRRQSEDPNYDCTLVYRVHASAADSATFPKMYLSFQEGNCVLGEPVSGVVPAGKAVRFSLTAPEAEEVLVLSDGSATRLVRQEDAGFSGSVTLGRGEAIVFAKYPRQAKHLALLKYRAK